MDKKYNNWLYLIKNINSVETVYSATILGAMHKETRMLKYMSDAGSRSAKKKLESKRLARINEMIDASSKSSNKKTITKKDYELIKVGAREHYTRNIKPIPSLAREQAVISFAAFFEGFIAEILGLISSATKDIKKKPNVKKIMYNRKTWTDYLISEGYVSNFDKNLDELFLVRNSIVHNNKKVSTELYKKIKKRRYKVGRSINVTDKDFARYKKAVLKTAGVIWRKFYKKYVKH